MTTVVKTNQEEKVHIYLVNGNSEKRIYAATAKEARKLWKEQQGETPKKLVKMC
jgi:hypothetical protein